MPWTVSIQIYAAKSALPADAMRNNAHKLSESCKGLMSQPHATLESLPGQMSLHGCLLQAST